MALVKCKECGTEISDQAKACPKCGAKPKKSVGPIGIVIVSIFGLAILSSIYSSNKAANTPPPVKTAEQIQADKIKEARFQKTVIAAATLKKAMREPESVVWENILANDDASIVCFEYRSKNGFGGMSRENAALTKGKFSSDANVWNKNCASKRLNDMLYVRQAL